MALDLFKKVDILNVHDYEQRAITKDAAGKATSTWLYSAYYEYFVTAEPLPATETNAGQFGWWYRIYARAGGELLERVDGAAQTYAAARGAAQAAIKKAMEKYKMAQS